MNRQMDDLTLVDYSSDPRPVPSLQELEISLCSISEWSSIQNQIMCCPRLTGLRMPFGLDNWEIRLDGNLSPSDGLLLLGAERWNSLERLVCLDLHSSLITSLELHTLPSLRYVDVQGCSSLQGMLVQNCKSIQDLDLSMLEKLSMVRLINLEALASVNLFGVDTALRVQVLDCPELLGFKPNMDNRFSDGVEALVEGLSVPAIEEHFSVLRF
jgi:hypothetical protein